MPDRSIPREAAFQIINDELMLDGNPRLNLASFVTTWMEPECDKLIMGSINKNYVDMDEYPVTTELQVPSITNESHQRASEFVFEKLLYFLLISSW
jgi:glutamate decarboxylase